jgi:hypothetical protein
MNDEITNWKYLRVCYSWENKAWGLYETTSDHKLKFIDGFWETEKEAHEALDEYNKNYGVPL